MAYPRMITVKEAIEKGLKDIYVPSRNILISSIILPLLLIFIGAPFFTLILIPIGVFISIRYSAALTIEWRIWAYEAVEDIHQLQRSAELAGILMKQSYDTVKGPMNSWQRETLQTLIQRFEEDVTFIDDSTIPQETTISTKFSNTDVIKINEQGILIFPDIHCSWNDINNDRIAQVTYNRLSGSTGGRIGAGSKNFLRFSTPEINFEYALSAMNIDAWELDLLLYIYRGRYNKKNSAK